MSDGGSYGDIIVLALIAGFILLRLRSVLGRDQGNDHPQFFTQEKIDQAAQPVVHAGEKALKTKIREEPDSYLATLTNHGIADMIVALKEKDPQFTATSFLTGAKAAYEMIFDAFAKGDRQTLKNLLSDSLFKQFSDAIDARESEERRSETTLVSVVAKEISDITLNQSVARITVLFASEQVTVIRNPAGEIIEGDASHVHHSDEDWVFERNMLSKNPNWKIIET